MAFWALNDSGAFEKQFVFLSSCMNDGLVAVHNLDVTSINYRSLRVKNNKSNLRGVLNT